MTIGNGVKSIGDYTFSGCSSLTSITIPDSVTSIDGSAFYNVPNIGYSGNLSGAPWGARALNGHIEDGLVYEDSSKTELLACPSSREGTVVIPSSVTSIGEYAFFHCTGLTSITIPDSITSIRDGAFCQCSSLTSITIPDGVNTIGNYAFDGCSNLASVMIPDSVTTIGSGAFENCTKLTSITIPDSVKAIGSHAFYGCSNLASITIPDSVKTIGDYAFDGCSNLASVMIPDSVTTIGSGAFENCTNLTSVMIPDSVKTIGSCAFDGCSNLASVTIPDSIDSMGLKVLSDTAFYNDVDNWHDGVLYCGSFLLEAKDSIFGEYKVKDGTKVIADNSFYGCSALTSVVVPDSVTAIGDSAFKFCRNLLNVKISEGLKNIGQWAFSYCESLASVSIPKSVTRIGFEAFDYTALSNNESNWDGDVLYIGDCLVDANLDVSGEIEIKQGTRLIAEMAFDIYEGDHIYSMLKAVTIPTGVKIICDGAFGGCDRMEKIVIPSSVTQMGKNVFNKYAGDLVIYGYSDSCAQKYAKENGIAFELLSKPDIDPPTEEPTTEKPTDPVIEVIADTKTVTIDGVSVLAAVGDVKAADVLSAARGAKLLDKSGNAVNGDMPLATGMKIVFDNKTVEIAVLGDVDGNGEINVADARLALRQAVSLENLNGVYLFAGKVGGDSVGVSEARKILRAAVGLDDSKEWLK